MFTAKEKSESEVKALSDARTDPVAYRRALEALWWTRDKALREHEAKRAACEGREAELAAEQTNARGRLAGLEIRLRELRALAAAGEGVDVKAQEREVEQARHELEVAEGRALLLAREMKELAAKAPVLRDQAQRESAERFQAEARVLVPVLARALSEARRIAELLRALHQAADTAFPHASREAALVHGRAAGLPEALVPHWLLPDPYAQWGGRVGAWEHDAREAGFLSGKE